MSLFPEYYAREVRHKLGLSGSGMDFDSACTAVPL